MSTDWFLCGLQVLKERLNSREIQKFKFILFSCNKCSHYLDTDRQTRGQTRGRTEESRFSHFSAYLFSDSHAFATTTFSDEFNINTTVLGSLVVTSSASNFYTNRKQSQMLPLRCALCVFTSYTAGASASFFLGIFRGDLDNQ